MNKLTQNLIKISGWGASSILISVVLIFQLFIKIEIPSYTKIGVPALIAGLILFFICYRYLKGFINRKLQAAETTKMLGHTVSPVFTLLNDLLIVIPIGLTALIFLYVGQWSHTVGIILLECSGALQFGFISNIVVRIGQNGIIKQAEIDKMTANNTAIANEVKRLINIKDVEVNNERKN